VSPKGISESYGLHERRAASGWLGFDAYDAEDRGYLTPCWIYRKKPTQKGYCQMKMPDGSQPMAHRAFYEQHIGSIPEGLTLDHLCEVRNCVNPTHLEPVTRGANVLRGDTLSAANTRKTRCPRGHAYDEENTRVTPRGARACRACSRERMAEGRANGR
jgi:hypothetical protein